MENVMKPMLKILLLSAAVAVQTRPAFSQAPSAEDVNCAAEDMQALYYYLSPDPGREIKERATKCHGAAAKLVMPAWLEKEVPGMLERKVWKDPEEGELSEAKLWQAPFSILYELADKTGKNLPPVREGGTPASLSGLEAGYNDLRLRFLLSLDRLSRAGLEYSFGGRGTSLLSTMSTLAQSLDIMTGALAKGDEAGFYKGTGAAVKLSRGLFAQFFEEPRAGAGAKFVRGYTPEARILPGYRGVSLKVPGSQAIFLNSGDRIDMLVTFEAVLGTGIKEKVTATILQNVLVVKVSPPAAVSGTGVIQLLCNPNEAQYVALSLVQSGNINITRRAPGDLELSPMEIASFRKLYR